MIQNKKPSLYISLNFFYYHAFKNYKIYTYINLYLDSYLTQCTNILCFTFPFFYINLFLPQSQSHKIVTGMKLKYYELLSIVFDLLYFIIVS